MIEESKKKEFWEFLTTEKNQARPKGITVQRLAVVKPLAIKSDLWIEVIERHGASDQTAQEFYQSEDPSSKLSRADFWEAVRDIIRQGETERKTSENQNRKTQTAYAGRRKNPTSSNSGTNNRTNNRRKRY